MCRALYLSSPNQAKSNEYFLLLNVPSVELPKAKLPGQGSNVRHLTMTEPKARLFSSRYSDFATEPWRPDEVVAAMPALNRNQKLMFSLCHR